MTTDQNTGQQQQEPQSFEAAMERLETIVTNMEQGKQPLQETMEIFEEGMHLVKFCSAQLDKTEKKVELLLNEDAESPKWQEMNQNEEQA
jgi:exodeoxyribonuclease VII small subunit